MTASDEEKRNSVLSGRDAPSDEHSTLGLPWRVHLVDNTAVIDAAGADVAAIHGDYETEWTVMEERAAFIVTAANGHHKLVEALAKAAEQFERYAREHREKSQAAEFNGLQTAASMSLGKALTNEEFAEMCRAALSNLKEE